eukprot:242944_1
MSSDHYTHMSHMHTQLLRNKCIERGLFSLGTKQDLITRLCESTAPKCGSSSAGCRCKRYVAPARPYLIDQCKFCGHSPQAHHTPSFQSTDLNLKSNTLSLNCNDISYKSIQSFNIEITSCPTQTQKENNPPAPRRRAHTSHYKTKTLPPNPSNKFLISPSRMLQSETSLLRETSQDNEEEFKESEFEIMQQKRSKCADSHQKRDTVVAFGRQLTGLHHVIKKHLNLIDQQLPSVDKYIYSLQQTEISAVHKAREKALATEKKLLHEITQNVAAMNLFLNDIILIENAFNSFYTKQQRQKQKQARHKWAQHITGYQNKPRPKSRTESFIDLVFKAALYLSTFKEWLANVQQICQKNEIHVVHTSGASAKNVDRAFYKAFFVYNGHFNQMTDMLRCSLVFDDFDDLYHCFGIIETITRSNGGILRCKDRFDPEVMAFGYRDLLINIYCPDSEMVCEIQLHHQIWYQHKDISHKMYTKARLFDTPDGNVAYQYADEYLRKDIGKRVSPKMVNPDNLETIRWLKKWKLEKYRDTLIKKGWNDVKYWKRITKDKLMKEMRFLEGEAVKFMEESKQINAC